MPLKKRSAERHVALAALGAALLAPPLLVAFDKSTRIFGIPMLYLYLLLVWLAIIALTALIAERIPEQPLSSGAPRSDGGPPGAGAGDV